MFKELSANLTEEELLKGQINRFRSVAIDVLKAKNMSELSTALKYLEGEVNNTNFYYPSHERNELHE